MTILHGSVVPIWSHLEETLKRHEHALSKADKAMRAVRVKMADGSRLVGVRFPEKLLGGVKTRLAVAAEAEKAEEATRVAAAGASAGAGGASQSSRVRSEPPSAIDAKSLSKALTKPKTLLDFFGKAGASGGAAAAAAAAATPPASVKRPASASASGGAKKAKPSGGGGAFIGPFATAAAQKQAVAACPVCGFGFSGLSNGDLNKHLDQCVGGDEVVILE